ncbi:autotransporter outer membrane beta-barrel domain-containing protein [Brevundimonas faecalis]|uniref:autotransporter outer membrane beta-barrel domain-containing protein n=1 Tax=Brevundimonas faecalis TaxID=947378 RepID=UPI003609E9D6
MKATTTRIDRAHRPLRNWLCSTSLVVLAAAMPVGAVHAQEWTGTVSTDWGAAGNWQGGSLPTAVGDVFINSEGAGWPVINGGTRVANRVVIGDSADGGNLTIMGGGVLNTSDSVDIGFNNIGSAIVTGGGSAWNIASHLELGFLGTGTLTISNNGLVNSEDGYLSNRAQGSGTANVNSGGTWINSRDLFVGYQGTGALNIASAGVVAANRATYVGFYGPGTGTIAIDGANSLLTTGGFVVGVEGQGNVTVTNSGTIESDSGIIGEIAGSTGTVNLQSGSQWFVDTAVTVGAAGAGTLIVNGGADVTSQAATVGRNVGGNGTIVFLGNGSSWTNSGDFTIARDGHGIMTLGNAATVNSGLVTIGQNAGSTGSLTVSGVGRWTSSDAVVVGEAGNGKLRVDTLGQIASNGGSIGSGEGAAGTVEIVGAPTPSLEDRSMWNAGNSATVTVGGAGGQGSLFVSNDGVFHSGGLDISASDANGHTGSAIMTISSDADVSTANTGAIGSYAGSAGSVTVSGFGSSWGSSTLVVGSVGTGSLRVEDSGFVQTLVGRIGFATGSQGSVTVTGEGSLLRATTSLYVGDLGQGSLTVENGGDVRSTGGRIGQSAGGSGTALVTGNGSQWDARGGLLAIGDLGSASLAVTNQGRLLADTINIGTTGASAAFTASGGATVESDSASVGYAADRDGSATITGNGTSWNVAGSVSVGDAANGALTISNGAALNSAGSSIGNTAGATGNVLITGANSVWNLGPAVLSVGAAGTGTLAVENGGQILGDIDVFGGGTLRGNGTVGDTTVFGAGTLVGVQGQTLTVDGALTLFSAANVNVSLGTPGNATGLFNVTGDLRLDGTLNVTNAGGFGQGLYRVFDYTGTLNDAGLDVGAMPSGATGVVQTAVANQVNLLVSGMANDTQFWNGATTTADGVIHGGNGVWRAGPTNWTDANGTATESWGNQFAVFQNNPGAVTVDNSAGSISTTGMQFIGNNWNVQSGAITLNGAGGDTAIRVGDGTAAGSNWAATIDSAMTGSSRLVKDDLGVLILQGDNSYTGGTQINAGILQIGNNNTLGSITGDVLNNSVMRFRRSDATTFAGVISGSGDVQISRGDVTFTADNSYAGRSRTSNNTTLRLGNGGTTGSLIGEVENDGTLIFNRSNALNLGGEISGSGHIRQAGSGTTTLTGNSSGFTGSTSVENGILAVNGQLGGTVSVASAATLTGSGTVGAVSVANGGTLAGVQSQTLTTGNLALSSGSNVNAALGAPGGAGLFNVNGNLTLDGTLNVTNAGGFGQGVYRVFNYTGSLTDNGLDIGAMPALPAGSTTAVQTAMANQVNLIIANGGPGPVPAIQFWNGTTTTADGTIHGGNGIWVAGPTNWTDANGATAAAWDGKFAVFQNNPGIITVDNQAGAISTTGMQFLGDGWFVGGQALTLDGSAAAGGASIRVGDGTAAGGNWTATIDAELTGSAMLVKNDLGTLVLTGSNTYTGSTAIAAGTLQIGNGGTTGSISGAVDNAGTLAFNRSDSYTFGGQIFGTGAIRQIGGGTTTLTANSSGFTGTTTVENGTLAVNGRLGGSVGVQSGATLTGSGMLTGAVSVANGGTLAGVQGQTLMTGDLTLASGADVDVRLGAPGNTSLFRVAGDLTLDGTLNVTDAGGFGEGVYRIFDYTGTLTDNGLDVGMMPTGTAGSVQTAIAKQVNLLVGGSIGDTMFWNGTHTIANGSVNGGSGTWMAGPTNWTNANGSVAGAWNSKFAVFQTNPGTVTVNNSAGAVSTTGMQFIGSGWTVAGDAITLNGDNGQTTIRVGDGTAAGASHSATIGSELTGASRLIKNDLGTLILTGTNSYTGGTTIAAGTLQIGNGGATGSITGDVLNNGLLRFSRTDATSFGGLISGSGAAHVSHGQLTLTGNNSYTGGTAISNGATLTLGNGGTTGSIAGNVDVSGSLVFNRSNDLTYAGVISGSGSVRQIGTGKTELTGNSSGFTGTTFVDAGILAVNGQLVGTLDVLAAGRLQGIGTVGNTIVRGTIAPGNSIGTLNVAGNITFAAGSIYEVEANAAGQSDKILASGSATINGGTVQVLAGAGLYKPQTDYTILTAAGGVSGAFANVTSNLAFLDPSLKYDAGNVYLRLQRNDISFSGIGGTPNQVAAGEGTETLGWNNPVFDAVVNLSVPQAQDAFDQLSGEIHPSARTAMIEDSRLVRHAVWERLRASAGDEGRGVWGHAIGSWGHTSGDGNAARLDRNSAGLLMGLDASAGENVRLGAVWGYHQTDIDVDARASSAEIDNFHVGIYAGGQWDRLGVRAGAAYALQDIHTVRNIAFPGFSDTVRAGYNGETVQAFGELGYDFDLGRTQLEPYASVAYVRSRSNEFSETGGAAKLNGNRATTDVTFTTLGLRSTTSFNIGEADAKLKLGAGWRHAFGDNVPLTRVRYQAGGDAFSTMGVPVTRDSATIDAGLDVAVSGYTSIGLSYQGQIGDGLGDHTAKASIRFRF